jgi:hypothetical protein
MAYPRNLPKLMSRIHSLAWRVLAGSWLTLFSASAETLTVLNSPAGTTPLRLGYNLGHFMPDSNAADWFRYSGVDAARVFISVSEIEPTDDISPVGDGVNSEPSFFNRRSLLRTNAASTTATLSTSYVRWSTFISNYSDISTGNNRIQLSSTLANLRDRGVSILTNITASDSRFPLTGANDWAGRWELWQHYYAQAFILSRDYGVRNFSMFNEPNLQSGMTEEDWIVRYRFCSDAIQSAVADMNSRYGRSLVPQLFAPNTANGAEKYNTPGIDAAATDTWGRDAVNNRHLQLNGTISPSWMNLHIYNYQKYTTRTNNGSGFSGYIEDYNELRCLVDADTAGEPSLPLALTEFNVRTASSYDSMTATQNSPIDYTALGANCIALTGRGVNQLYLFKFGQTGGNNTPVYGVVKNGTHYVENSSAGVNNYGGATQCAEVYRLFNKAAGGARPRFNSTATSGASPTNTAGVWSLITYDALRGTYSAFIVNKGTAVVPLDVDFSALPLPADNPVYVEEVSATSNGGVVRMTRLAAGKLALADMPAQSVWLITVPGPAVNLVTRSATEDTQLGDGTSKLLTGASTVNLQVRADGTADGRRVCLVKIPIPAGNSPNVHSVILQLNAATGSGTTPVQAHVYGVTTNIWQEDTATWANTGAVLKQNVASGNQIQHNIVAAQGTTTQMLGQLVVDSPEFSEHSLNVTDFVKSSSGEFATFLIVQEHRWDIAQPALTPGDTQAEGMRISSKESPGGGARLVALTADTPADTGVAVVAREAVIRGGTSAALDLDEAAAGYLMVKFSSSLNNARKAYFQFDLPSSGVDLNAPANFTLRFTENLKQGIQLWALNGVYPGFSPAITWNNALANDPSNNGMLTGPNAATAVGAPVLINAGAGLIPYTFALPRLGDFVFSNRLTLVLSGVDDVLNDSQGIRISRASASLSYSLKPANTPPSISEIADLTLPEDGTTSALDFTVGDVETPAANLLVSASSSNPVLLPLAGIVVGGSGSSRSVVITPAAGLNGSALVTLVVSDGTDETSMIFQINVLPDAPWVDWRQLKFGNDWQNNSVAGPPADPDQDGITNLMEYALGGNPVLAETGMLPTIHQANNQIDYVFRRNLSYTDLRMTVQAASDLNGPWMDAAVSSGGAAFVALIPSVSQAEDNGSPVRLVSIVEDVAGRSRRFMRLRVELLIP